MDAPFIEQTPAEAQSLGDILGERAGTLRVNGSATRPHEAIGFLKWLDPTGRHNLVALDPTGRAPPEGRTFDPGQWAAMAEWVDKRNNRLNLYYSANEPAAGAPDKKLADRDIAAIRAVVADLDPRQGEPLDAERARLKTLAGEQGGQPAVIDSGGGVQLIWRLEEKLDPIVHAAAARAQGRGVAKALGGDAVIDAARIMRLPGTVNLPDAKKLARGRAPAMASRVSVGGSISLPALAAIYPPAFAAEQADRDDEIAKVQAALDMSTICGTTSLDDLDEPLRTRLQAMLASDKFFHRLWDGDPDVLPGDDESGSAFRAEVARRLGREGGFTAQQFGEVLYAWPHAVLAGQDIEEIVTARTIARDWVRCGLPHSPERWFEPVADQQASIWDTAPPEAPAADRPFELVDFVDAADAALAIDSEPLVEDFLERGSFGVFYGASGVGKTFVALDLAFHVALGMPWNGRRVRRMRVIYLACEGAKGARKRADALRRRWGIPDDALRGWFLYRMAPVNLLDSAADLRDAISAIQEIPDAGLVVVDTLSRALAGGDENSSVDMGAFVKNVDRLRAATSACVLSVHHTGKDAARGARGHSLLRAATDTEVEIAEGIIEVSKQREIETNFKIGFRLEPVRLGQHANGREITSCIVRYETPASSGLNIATSKETIVLLALNSANSSDRKGVKPERISEVLGQSGTVMKPETVRTHLKNLKKKDLVICENRGCWSAKSGSSGLAENRISKIPEMNPEISTGRNVEDDVFT